MTALCGFYWVKAVDENRAQRAGLGLRFVCVRHAGEYLVTEWICQQGAPNSWFITGEQRQQFMLSIRNRVMPGGADGGGSGDPGLILDNDTVQTHMGEEWSYFPSGQEEQR